MIIQTFKMQFQCVMWITRHSSIWIAKNSIHCSLPTQLRKLAKSGSWHCHLSGNVLGHAWQTWCKKGTNGKRMSCSLLICHMQISNLLTLEQWAFEYGLLFLIRTVYIFYIYNTSYRVHLRFLNKIHTRTTTSKPSRSSTNQSNYRQWMSKCKQLLF